VEAESILTEKQDQVSTLTVTLDCPTSPGSKTDIPVTDRDQADINVNRESIDSPDETVKSTPPSSVSPTAFTINNSPTSSSASNSCTDNTQFLASRSPVYA
jgi:hypothetical protein